ncbi:fibronectin type III [Scenedesmus sp. NREL 46B-D3]|nr:fibronectin type III [Scenedesmus sp. NREL 46B-D3]
MQAPALAQRARNALKLKWNMPDEAGGEVIQRYELLVTPQPAGWEGPAADEQGFTQVYVGDERSYKLGKLGPGQRFSFKIRSFNVLGCGPWSLPSTFTTQASVPAQPEPPVQVASSKDAATLQWRPPAENGALISCYQLEVDDGRQGEFRLAYTGLELQCVVQKLQSGLNYRFRLRAENSEGYSMWSAVAAAATAATTPACPTGLAAVGINRTSVTLTWQPPHSDGGSPVLAYQVQLSAKTKVAAAALGSDWVIIFDGAAVATTFSALQPGCEYMVRVAARNAAGQGQFCIPLRLTTASDVPLQPPKPEAEPAATSLLLRWAAPQHDGGSQVTGYKVEMRCSPDASSSTAAIGPQHSLAIPEHFLNIYSGPDVCVQVTDLLPGTAYEYRAAALNSHGAGPWSDIGTATTLPAAPLPPPAPQLAACTSSSLSVSWVEPYGQGSPVSSYTLNMARLGPVGGSGSSSGANGAVHALANGTAADGSAQHPSDAHDDAASSCSSSLSADKVRWETVYTGPLTAADVRHLKPACRYMLRVRAHNSIGGSCWGEALTATTSPAAPNQPASLTATAVSSSAILLRWSAPLEDNGAAVTSYQLEMAAAGGSSSSSSSSWSKVYQGSSLEHQHSTGLLPGRSYSWRMRAINSCGAGVWSEPVKGSTLPAEPGAPAKPGFSQRTATSVKVKWGLPQEENGSAVSTYILELRQLASGPDVQQQQQQWQQAYRGPELSQKVTGLQPGSSYEVRVVAMNAVGLGPWSDCSSVEVLKRPPPPPASLHAELEGGADAAAAGSVPACLLVSWPAAEAAADSADAVGYEVEAAPALSSSHAVLRSNVAKQTSTSISSGLQLGVTYNVRVRSVGAAGTGHSSWSAAVAVVIPAAPAAPASEGDASESALALVSAAAAEAGAGKRKAKAKPKASAKDAAAVAEKRSSKAAAVVKVEAKGKPKKPTMKDHILNALPPQLSRWLKKHSKLVKFGVIVAAVIVILIMCWWGRSAGALQPEQASFQQMHMQAQHLQEP